MVEIEDPRREAEAGLLMTFDAVQERMVEAMLLWRRAPDRERGWLTVRAYWPEISRQGWRVDVDGEHDEREADEKPDPRPLPLTRDEVAEMQLVGEWLGLVPEQDRKLVVYALAALASGRRRVPWLRLRRPLGVKLGADGLRKRYGAALAGICAALNAQKTAENRPGIRQP